MSKEIQTSPQIPTTHVVLACDESGAKGYSDRDETTLGETGVFAGLLVPLEYLDSVGPQFDALVKKYATDVKLHITDLAPAQQAALRDEIFSLIRKFRIPCFYEAIHVAGFHEAYKNGKKLIRNSSESKRSGVKTGARGAVASSLHVSLFQGLYSKVIAFCLERDKCRLHIEVRTDRVDSPLVKNFEKTANELLDLGAKIKRVTGFDPAQKKILQGKIEVRAVTPELNVPVTVEHLEIKVVNQSDGLVIAADVLANSLDHLFRTRTHEELYRPLNCPEAFANHPLSTCINTFHDWGQYNFTDTFYAHPRAQKEQ